MIEDEVGHAGFIYILRFMLRLMVLFVVFIGALFIDLFFIGALFIAFLRDMEGFASSLFRLPLV